MKQVCSHLDQIRVSTTNKRGCEECMKTGDSWVHLRLCMECGHVGCCDSSKTNTPQSIFIARSTPWSARWSAVRVGSGATWTRTSSAT